MSKKEVIKMRWNEFNPECEQKISFKNSIGDVLVGVLNVGPDAADNKSEWITRHKDVIIFAPGLAVHKNWGIFPFISTGLKSIVASFRLDFTGIGESGGDPSIGHGFDSLVEDLRAAVLMLRKKGYRVLGLLGHCFGVSPVFLYSSKYHDVPLIINISGRFDMHTGWFLTDENLEELKQKGTFSWQVGKRSYHVTKQMLEERQNTDMSFVKNLTCRVLTVHGNDDDTVPVAEAFKYDIIPKKFHTRKIIDGANHFYTSEKMLYDMIRQIVNWVSEQAILASLYI